MIFYAVSIPVSMEFLAIAPGTDERYMVSSRGNVKNAKTGRLLKLRVGTWGYWYVLLSLRPASRALYKTVLRMMGQAFLHNPDPSVLTTIDHIDRNPKNNDLCNLR
jgi:hypothetical protein